jgi:DNA-binding PadR family transcriptional regulator
MSLNYAILSFLNFAPMSGYDLKKYFDDSIHHFWSATQSHIYRSLNQMEDEGWITHESVEQEGRPDRKVYSITPLGQQNLHTWLTTPLPLDNLREAWLIQIFFAHNLSNPELESLLAARLTAVRERLCGLQGDAQESLYRNAQNIGIARASALWQMTLDYGIAMYQAEIAWLETAIEKARHLPAISFPQPPLDI